MTVGDVCTLGSRLTGTHFSATSADDDDFLNAYCKLLKQVNRNNAELFSLDEPDKDGGQLMMLCTRIARCGTAKALKDPPPAVIPPFTEGKREATAREHLGLNGKYAVHIVYEDWLKTLIGLENCVFETRYKYMHNVFY